MLLYVQDMTRYQRFYDVVLQIPPGRVMTYGGVAEAAGLPGHARQAGYAMAALPDGSDVPWHRVINARGEVSRRSGGRTFEHIQRVLLEAEDVPFDARGRVDLDRYGWFPPRGGDADRRKASTTDRK